MPHVYSLCGFPVLTGSVNSTESKEIDIFVLKIMLFYKYIHTPICFYLSSFVPLLNLFCGIKVYEDVLDIGRFLVPPWNHFLRYFSC